MAFEFKLPDVGEGLHEAELLKWMVNEGDYVREDQPLMEVQTDKAAVEITSPVTGKVVKLLGKPEDILHVHSVVVVFDDGTEGTVQMLGEDWDPKGWELWENRRGAWEGSTVGAVVHFRVVGSQAASLIFCAPTSTLCPVSMAVA